MRIVAVEAEAWTLALRAPFVIARRTAHEAQNVRVTVRTEDSGLSGLGEGAPVGYVTGESVASVLSALEAVGPEFVGQSVERLGPLLASADHLLPDAPAARAALEMALYDLWARHWRLPLWQFFGGAQATLTTDLTVPLVPPGEAGVLANAALGEGFRHLKIKVGDPQGHAADLARVEAIARAAPGVRLRIDANQGFEPDGAVRFAQALAATGAVIELLEQPVGRDDWRGLKYVRERVSMPVFADESARDVPSVRKLLQEDAVDGVNVKLMKSGLAGALANHRPVPGGGQASDAGLHAGVGPGHRGGGPDRGRHGRVRLSGPGLPSSARAGPRPVRRLHGGEVTRCGWTSVAPAGA